MQIPELLTDFRVYSEGADLLGVATVSLPSFDPETDEIRGAGIAGTIDTPALGQMKSMQVGLDFRTMTKATYTLQAPKIQKVNLYGSLQMMDGAAGTLKQIPCKIYIQGLPKKKELGKFDSGKKTETKIEFEIVYIKITLEGKDVVELDKLNYIYMVDGKDYLADVRPNLGL